MHTATPGSTTPERQCMRCSRARTVQGAIVPCSQGEKTGISSSSSFLSVWWQVVISGHVVCFPQPPHHSFPSTSAVGSIPLALGIVGNECRQCSRSGETQPSLARVTVISTQPDPTGPKPEPSHHPFVTSWNAPAHALVHASTGVCFRHSASLHSAHAHVHAPSHAPVGQRVHSQEAIGADGNCI